MILVLDNFDSFTYNLVDYFKQLNVAVKVIRNDVHPSKINWDTYKALILSPGPETPEKANYLMDYINICQDKLPILGICLGHQAINMHFGGTLNKCPKPMHGKVSTFIQSKEDSLFVSLPKEFKIVRYHSLKINSLAPELDVLGSSEDNCPMIIKHKNKCIYGIQYHPESILTEYGLKILHNWLILAGIYKGM